MAGALYQKYRPFSFAEVFGETHIVKALTNAINGGQMSHAYIFSGPRGIGKTTIAKILAKAINCLTPKNGDACNECTSCTKINNLHTMDVQELDAASNNGVAEIRQIIDSVNYLPTDLQKKVYILDEAHMLTTGAWNALLKTLEECPSHVVFIFATTEYHKIPLTIISRCQCYSFKRLTVELLSELLSKVAKKEQIKIEPEAIEKLAVLADGSARDAISSLDQISSYSINTKINTEDIDSIFGLLDQSKKIEFINLLARNDISAALSQIEQYEADGVHFGQLIEDTFGFFIDIYLYTKTNSKSNPKNFHKKDWNKIEMSGSQALVFAEIWEELTGKIKHNQNIKYNLELAIFKGINTNSKNSNNTAVISSDSLKKVHVVSRKDTNIADDSSLSNQSSSRQSADFIVPLSDLKSSDIHEITQKNIENLDAVFETKEYDLPQDKGVKSVSADVKNDDKKDGSNSLNIQENHKSASQDTTSQISKKIDGISVEEIFIKLAAYHNPKIQKDNQAILEVLKSKEWFQNEPISNLLIDATKVLIAADEGIVVLFENEDESILLNAKSQTVEFIHFCNQLFGKPLYVIGVTKSMAKNWTNNFKKIKSEKTIERLDLSQISKFIIKKPSTEEIALDYFGDDLKIEDSSDE
ncbi:DNA polymerase III subunit gamma/tau [[Mycoplasma] testudinis]|uniref:DNA polymerase III subunit gamma/tau n=1 Tax=[Mycoplasma] testudinis TaxID=33924 RepID=UPI000696982D|nr:DNA polymerase III subunit gamma/tau [[Mycoplasma] testudinis]